MTDNMGDRMSLGALVLMAAAEEAGLEVRFLDRPGDVPAVAFKGGHELVADPRKTDCYDLWAPAPPEVLIPGVIDKDREPVRFNLTLDEAITVIREEAS